MIIDRQYKQCCKIAERLEETDTKELYHLLIFIFANFPETRDYVLTQYFDI